MSTISTRSAEGTTLTFSQLDANFKQAAQAKTADYTVAVSDNRDTIEFDGDSLTATLPDAATIVGAADPGDFQVTVKNVNASALTAAASGEDTIDGAASISLKQYEGATFKVNHAGDGWNVLGAGISGADDDVEITGGTIDGTPIGGTTAAAGAFTTGAFSDAVSSTKSAASGYTRITPNYCKRSPLGYPTYDKSITSTGNTTIAAPAGATLCRLLVSAVVGGSATVFVASYDGTSYNNADLVEQVTFSAAGDAGAFLECPVDGDGNINIRVAITGGSGTANLSITGYYD